MAEAAQRLPVIVPFACGVLASSWSMAVKASAVSLALSVSGFCLSVLFFIKALLFDGAAIKERILAKQRKRSEETRKRTFSETVERLSGTPELKEVRLIVERYVQSVDKVRKSLQSTSSAKRLMFEGHFEQTHSDIEAMIGSLREMESGDRRDVVGFIEEACEVLDVIRMQCDDVGELQGGSGPMEKAERNLEQLKGRVDAAHRAMEAIQSSRKRSKELE